MTTLPTGRPLTLPADRGARTVGHPTRSITEPLAEPIATDLAARDPRWRDVRQYLLDTDAGLLRTITVDGAADGVPQLFVHGLGVSAATWIDVLPQMARRGPVAAIDLPGHGGSEPAAGVRTDIATLTTIIDAARQALGWDRMELHGNSLGALLAARHAVAKPRTVERLVLAAPAFSPGPAGVRELSMATLLGLGPLVVPVVGELALRGAAGDGAPFPGAERMVQAVFADPEALRPSLQQLFADESAGLARHRWRRDGTTTTARSLFAELAAWWRTDATARAVTVPTTVIAGAEDRLLPPGAVARLRGLREDWTFHTLADAGHSPFVDRPDAYVQLVSANAPTTA